MSKKDEAIDNDGKPYTSDQLDGMSDEELNEVLTSRVSTAILNLDPAVRKNIMEVQSND